MSDSLRVLIEVRAAARGNAATVNLPGFKADTRHGQIRVPADDSCDTDRIVVRGTVGLIDLEGLRRDPRVIDVYLDTEAVPYPDILAIPRDPLADAAHLRFE